MMKVNKFFLNEDPVSIQVEKIITTCRRYMDGEIVSKLNKIGVRYKVAFGVSRFNLKEIAQLYRKDESLANRLWFREIRETMILATFIYPPKDITLEKLEQILSVEVPHELIEQLAMNCLQESNIANELFNKWSLEGDVNKCCLALLTQARLFQRNAKIESSFDIDLLFKIDLKSEEVARAMSFLFRQIVRLGYSASKVEQFIQFNKDKGKLGLWLSEEIQNELDYCAK